MEYRWRVPAFVMVDNQFEQLAGLVITASGLALVALRRSWMVAIALMFAGVTWLMASASVGPPSTTFLHRAGLTAAIALAATPFWRSWPTLAPLTVFAAVCAVPGWALNGRLSGAAWSLAIAHTTWAVRTSPRRARVLPALIALTVMMLVASVGQQLEWMTNGERRMIYHFAALAAAVLTARAAIRPVAPDAILEAGSGVTWSVGVRAPGEEHFVGIDGRTVDLGTAHRSVEFDVGELGTAVLVHDDPVFNDPGMRESLQEAVRVLAARASLLRRIESQGASVEISRRRLLEADREAAAATSLDVERSVQPHLDEIARLLTDGDVPPDHRAVRLLGEIGSELRELSSGAPPTVLDHGLVTALRRLAERSPVPTEVLAAPVEVGPDLAFVLFMVASEAAANAAKHSGATHLLFELKEEQHDVMVRVADDGRGGAAMRRGGGLELAHTRVAAIGGTIDVQSNEGGGTVITARVPRPT